MALLGYPRGHRVNTETGCPLGTRLQAIRILTLEPEHLKNERPPPKKSPEMEGLSPEMLKRLAI